VLQDLHHRTASCGLVLNGQSRGAQSALHGRWGRTKQGVKRGGHEQVTQGCSNVESVDTRSAYGPRRPVVAERKIPADVVSSIPTQDGDEVPQDPGRCTYKNRVHFVPTSIAPKLHQYINSRLGGVCKMLRST
jgi:hypothetical protein